MWSGYYYDVRHYTVEIKNRKNYSSGIVINPAVKEVADVTIVSEEVIARDRFSGGAAVRKFQQDKEKLIVNVNYSYDHYVHVTVFPSEGAPAIAKSERIGKGYKTLSFNLNPGNYAVECGYKQGVQIIKGKSVTLDFNL